MQTTATRTDDDTARAVARTMETDWRARKQRSAKGWRRIGAVRTNNRRDAGQSISRRGTVARMALVHMVRAATVARLLGVSSPTILAWCRRLGLQVRYAPAALPDRRGGKGPAYLDLASAVAVADRLVPAQVDAALHRHLRRASAALSESTRNIRNREIGGTGSGIPPSNPLLHHLREFSATQPLDASRPVDTQELVPYSSEDE